MDETLRLSPDARTRFAPVLAAIREHAASLATVADLVSIRPGLLSDGVTPAVVLGFRPPSPAHAELTRANLAGRAGVAVEAREASPLDQLQWQAQAFTRPLRDTGLERWYAGIEAVEFAPPSRGTYKPPEGPGAPRLDAVDDEMRVTLCASPDAGWPVLEQFLAQRVDERLAIGMYQFTAPHVYKALRKTMLADDDAELRLTMHPHPEEIPSGGTKANDIPGQKVIDRLRSALGTRFAFAFTDVRKGGTFPKSYHIKVAVADRKRMWLSSGNWQSSNLPPFDPIGEPEELPAGFHRSYNRDYHLVIEHQGLAETYEGFLAHDLATASGVPIDFAAPEVLVPVEIELPADFAPPRFFPRRVIERRVRVQPILTPDNYPTTVLALLRSAERSILFQNQYINLNVAGDFPEFKRLVAALREKIEEGLDVRIICRDLMEQDKLDMLLALGFPRERFRFLAACHNKTIIVDGKRILVGSHNWSNEGTVENRDASLLFDDEEIAAYYTEIYEYDWERATAKPKKKKPRVVRAGESFDVPMQRMSLAALYDDGLAELAVPPQAEVPPAAAAAVAASAAGSGAAAAAESPAIAGTTGDAAAEVAPPPPAAGPQPIAFEVLGGGGPVVGGGGPIEPAAVAATPTVQLSGVDGATGHYLTPATSAARLATVVRGSVVGLSPELRAAKMRTQLESFGLPFGIDRNDLARTGWGVVFANDADAAIQQALEPLIAHRRAQIGTKMVKVLDYLPGEDVRSWLNRHGVALGTVMPRTIPYHLLLVGSPSSLPFTFQYLLDLEYSVGRLWWPNAAAASFESYARSVVAYETAGGVESSKEIAYFAPRHLNDPATELSSGSLVSPLEKGDQEDEAVASLLGYRSRLLIGKDATQAALLDVLAGQPARPACLFTAGHGIGYVSGHADQPARQGALLTQDWTGPGDNRPEATLAAADVGDGARLHGLVAFLFACYGAGTPERDQFPLDLDTPAKVIAPRPFVAALPNRLLAHPGGGALGVLGHVDRAWSFSIQPPGVRPVIQPFRNAIGTILNGECLGNATKDFGDRHAILSAELLASFAPGAPPRDEGGLVLRWLERNDAGSYVLLGDPAARVRTRDLA